jgi:hypothetical protein
MVELSPSEIESNCGCSSRFAKCTQWKLAISRLEIVNLDPKQCAIGRMALSDGTFAAFRDIDSTIRCAKRRLCRADFLRSPQSDSVIPLQPSHRPEAREPRSSPSYAALAIDAQ